MKKMNKRNSIIVLCAFLTFATPVIAQTDNGTTSATTRTDDGNNDHHDWGWIGLAGLLGLLGLRKKDDKHIHVERRSEMANPNR